MSRSLEWVVPGLAYGIIESSNYYTIIMKKQCPGFFRSIAFYQASGLFGTKVQGFFRIFSTARTGHYRYPVRCLFPFLDRDCLRYLGLRPEPALCRHRRRP